MYKHWTISHKGGRTTNQDFSAVIDDNPNYFLAVLCDGMGGNEGGEIASGMAVKIITDYIKNIPDGIYHTALLYHAVATANEQIWNTSKQYAHLANMGTTVVSLLLLPNGTGTIVYVGDSRCYHIRNGQRLYRTTDHSQVFELLQRGILKNEEEARLSEKSNIITQALGVKPNVQIAQHDVTYQPGDRFLLSSDGIHGIMPEQQLLQILMAQATFKDAAETLNKTANQIGIQQGNTHDNLTAIVLDCGAYDKKIKLKTRQTQFSILAVFSLILICLSTWLYVEHFRKQKNINDQAQQLTQSQKNEVQQISKKAKWLEQYREALIGSSKVLILEAQQGISKQNKNKLEEIEIAGKDVEYRAKSLSRIMTDILNVMNGSESKKKYDSIAIATASKKLGEVADTLEVLGCVKDSLQIIIKQTMPKPTSNPNSKQNPKIKAQGNKAGNRKKERPENKKINIPAQTSPPPTTPSTNPTNGSDTTKHPNNSISTKNKDN